MSTQNDQPGSTDTITIEGGVLAEESPSSSVAGDEALTQAPSTETSGASSAVGTSAGASSSEHSAGEDSSAPPDDERGPTRASALEREGEVAADFLEKLLDIADLDGDIDVDVDGDRAAVAIVDSEEGRVPRRLVGENARVLEALQELTRLAVQQVTGERSRLMLDIAGWRAARRETLTELGIAVAGRVLSSGGREELQPMTPFERKIVHDAVAGIEGVVSESEGAEPQRRVVVLVG